MEASALSAERDVLEAIANYFFIFGHNLSYSPCRKCKVSKWRWLQRLLMFHRCLLKEKGGWTAENRNSDEVRRSISRRI